MLTAPAGLMIYVATRPVDFRKGADGLALLAKETLGYDPMKGVAVVFRAKRADRMKIVVWDGSGLVLYWKRLEGGVFKWPPVVDGAMRMNAAQLSALHGELQYTEKRRPIHEKNKVLQIHGTGRARNNSKLKRFSKLGLLAMHRVPDLTSDPPINLNKGLGSVSRRSHRAKVTAVAQMRDSTTTALTRIWPTDFRGGTVFVCSSPRHRGSSRAPVCQSDLFGVRILMFARSSSSTSLA